MKFLIAIEPGRAKTAYGVVVPDLAGCFSAGYTPEQTFDNAREAIEAHCELLADDGQDIPAARPLAEHQADHEMAGWFWAMVDVPVECTFGPAEKINITVPPRVLAPIDEFARKRGESRSGFLVRAAQEAMGTS
jgi:predicted RNase H-like HicB family nuclease